MTKAIRVAERAQEDLLEIYEYFAEVNPDKGERLLLLFRDKFNLLLRHPLIGRERDELIVGLRSFPADRYIIFYQPMDDGIEVLRVRHGASDLQGLFDI